MKSTRVFALLGVATLAVGTSLPSRAFANFDLRKQVQIGKPAQAATIHVVESAEGTTLEVGHARTALPVSGPSRADTQIVVLATGARIVVVRVAGAEGREAAAVIGRSAKGEAAIVWSGHTDLRGDPGERSGYALEVSNAPNSGEQTVTLSELEERARVCGQNRSALHPMQLDPKSMTFVPVAIDRLAKPPASELQARAESPGPTGPPVIHALRLVAVSSRAGDDPRGGEPESTTALTDGDPATYWSEGNPGGARGEFATFARETGAFGLRALAFVLVPANVRPGTVLAVPRTLLLVGESGPSIRVRLPDAVEAGKRYFVAFDKPVAWRCVSVLFEESASPTTSTTAHAALAEVEGYTDLDFGPGIERLIEALNGKDAAAADAAQLLSGIGAQVAPKLKQAWPSLDVEGRRRALRVLAPLVESNADARATLLTAAGDDEAAISKAAFDGLLAAGPKARAGLLPWIARTNASGDAAANALARHDPEASIGALLDALAAEHGADRAALRAAIAVAVEARSRVLDAVRGWVEAHPDTLHARAALAASLASLRAEAPRKLASEIVATDAARASEFDDLWRLVEAAHALPSDARSDAWLATLAAKDDHWMLRAAAIDALNARSAAQRITVATAALKTDPYPRVRMAAAQALADQPAAFSLLSTRAARDAWPMVRVTAIEAIERQPGAEVVLRASLGDRTHQARAAALRALTNIKARDAWPLVEQHLRDKDEWPDVLTESVHFARALCVQSAAPSLIERLRAGLKPDAWSPDVDVAVLAFEALSDLGGQAASTATQLANSPAAPSVFHTAAKAQASRKPSCAVE